MGAHSLTSERTFSSGACSKDFLLSQKRRRNSRTVGQVYFWKVAKNFGQQTFLSAREDEHGRFRAFFPGERQAKV